MGKFVAMLLSRSFAAIVFAWTCQAVAQTPDELTLEQVLDSVEKVNVNVLLSRESVAQALATANLQRADLIPTVTGSLAQRRTQSASISATSRSEGLPSNRFDGRLAGSFNLLSPQQIAQYRASLLGVRVAEFDLLQTVQNVLAATAQTYFLHLRNIKRVVVLEQNVARAAELAALAFNRRSTGVGTDIDVTRAEASLAIAQQARIQQDTAVYQSELLLKRLLDLLPDHPLKLADFVLRQEAVPDYTVAFETTSFEKRADYLRSKQALEQNRAQLRAVTVERFGALSLSGDYGYANRAIFQDDDQRGWSAGLSYSVPVFDAFRIKTNERVALSQIRSQEFRHRQLELLIASELRLANRDAKSRFSQVAVAERNLKLAQQERDLAFERLQKGDGDNREMVDSDNRLAQASDNMNEALYQYNLSRLELARSRGDVRQVLLERSPGP